MTAMTMLRRVLVGLTCGFIAVAPARAQIDVGSAESLMRQSGLWLQLDGVVQQVRAGTLAALANAPTQPSASEVARLTSAIDAAYATDRMRAVALATLTGGIDARQVTALRRWFDSPLGRAVTQLEEAASVDTAEPPALMQQGTALLEAMPAERRALLAELVQVSRTAEVATELTINTSLAAMRGLASVQPGTPPDAMERLSAALEGQRPQLMQSFTALSLAAFAKSYQALASPDLMRYVEFLKSAAGQHFSQVAARALEAAMVEASTDYGRRLPATRDGANA